MEKRPNRIKYTCRCGIKVWGKYNLRLKCLNCDWDEPMVPEMAIKPYDFPIKRKQPSVQDVSFDECIEKTKEVSVKLGAEKTKIVIRDIMEGMKIKSLTELKDARYKRKEFWRKLNKSVK